MCPQAERHSKRPCGSYRCSTGRLLRRLIKVGADCFDWAPLLLFLKRVAVGLLNARRSTEVLERRYHRAVHGLVTHPAGPAGTAMSVAGAAGGTGTAMIPAGAVGAAAGSAAGAAGGAGTAMIPAGGAGTAGTAVAVTKPLAHARELVDRYALLLQDRGRAVPGWQRASKHPEIADAAHRAVRVKAAKPRRVDHHVACGLVQLGTGVFNSKVDRGGEVARVSAAEVAFVASTTLVTVAVDLNVARGAVGTSRAPFPWRAVVDARRSPKLAHGLVLRRLGS